MQRQTNVLNLFVEFRFQLFNMKTLFYFELRVSAGMIENLKTRDITLIPTTFRSTEMFKNVGIFVPNEMLIKIIISFVLTRQFGEKKICISRGFPRYTFKLRWWLFQNRIYQSLHYFILTLFRLGFFGQSVTGGVGGGVSSDPPLYLWNQ